jgi:hypothetical protein
MYNFFKANARHIEYENYYNNSTKHRLYPDDDLPERGRQVPADLVDGALRAARGRVRARRSPPLPGGVGALARRPPLFEGPAGP